MSHELETTIRWSVCSEGHLHVDVLDAQEEIVSSFAMSTDEAETFAVGIIGETGRWRRCVGDTIGQTAGRA